MKLGKVLRLLILANLALPAAAGAQLSISYFASDSEVAPALSDSLFVAQGRIGDLLGTVTFELSIGPSTTNPVACAQHGWQNEQPYSFTLTYDVATHLAVFGLAGQTLCYVTDYQAFDAIFIRSQAVVQSSSVHVYDLVLDGITIPGSCLAEGPNGLQIMQIYGAPLRDGFTLTGDAMMVWGKSIPTNSQLTFQIKVANMLAVDAEADSWGRVKALFQ